MKALLDGKVLTGVQAVELGNIARDCESITSPSSRYDIQAAANKLHQLGLISDADHIQFERYYKECALVDAAKVLVPPGWKTNLHQDHEGKWCRSMTEDDPLTAGSMPKRYAAPRRSLSNTLVQQQPSWHGAR
jgi:hypothetical protein